MKKKALFLVLALWMSWIGCYADEGMWIPMLLKKYNIEDMQKEGFKLTAEDIQKAKAVIIAADKAVEMDRFDGKPLINRPVADGIRKTEELINLALSG